MSDGNQPPMSRAKKLFLFMIALFAGSVLVAHHDAEERRSEAAAKEAAREAAMTPEQKAKQKEEEARRTALRAQAIVGAVALRRSMKDPTAFTLTSLVLMPDGAKCYEFRAKNSFGAILPGEAILTEKGKMLLHERDGNAFVSAWNASCTKPRGEDLTSVANDGFLNKPDR